MPFKALADALHRRAGRAAPHVRVTVVMPTYNDGARVGAAIRSILGQSHGNLHLMVFDDASNDDTAARVLDIARNDQRVSLYRAFENRGPYAAKNWCMARVQTDFLTFQDSDDIAHPDRLQLQLGAMRRYGAAASTVRWRRIDDQGRFLRVNGMAARLAANSLMIRRAPVLARVGYFDPVRQAADSEYLGRIDALIGAKARLKLKAAMITGAWREGSITTRAGSGVTWSRTGDALERRVVGARKAYHQAAEAWHTGGHARPLLYGEVAPFAPDVGRVEAHGALGQGVEQIWPVPCNGFQPKDRKAGR